MSLLIESASCLQISAYLPLISLPQITGTSTVSTSYLPISPFAYLLDGAVKLLSFVRPGLACRSIAARGPERTKTNGFLPYLWLGEWKSLQMRLPPPSSTFSFNFLCSSCHLDNLLLWLFQVFASSFVESSLRRREGFINTLGT